MLVSLVDMAWFYIKLLTHCHGELYIEPCIMSCFIKLFLQMFIGFYLVPLSGPEPGFARVPLSGLVPCSVWTPLSGPKSIHLSSFGFR